MRCPICDAKLEGNLVCKYCNITKEQIENGSNKKVKQYRKEDKADLIYYTNVLPKEISRLKLILFTIFLGVFGVNHFYVHRNNRGLYAVLSMAFAVFFHVLNIAVVGFSQVYMLMLIYEICIGAFAFSLLFWISDIISVLIGKFKVPIVLGDKE